MQIEKPFIEEIHFDNGTRQTIYHIKHIEQGNWWHIFTEDNRYYIVNPEHILFIRVYGTLTDDIKSHLNSETKNKKRGKRIKE